MSVTGCRTPHLASLLPQGTKKPFAVFFGAAGVGGHPRLHALLTRSSSGLRALMKNGMALGFAAPLMPSDADRRVEADLVSGVYGRVVGALADAVAGQGWPCSLASLQECWLRACMQGVAGWQRPCTPTGCMGSSPGRCLLPHRDSPR